MMFINFFCPSLFPVNLSRNRATGHDESANGSQNISLCSDCKAVDWSGIVSTQENVHGIQADLSIHTFGKVLRIFKNPTRAQLLNSTCRVCRLVGQLSRPDTDDGLRIPSQGQDVPPAYLLEWVKHYRESEIAGECVMLAVRSLARGKVLLPECDDYTVYIRFLLAHKFSDSRKVQIRTLQPSEVCFDFLKSRLKLCCKNHVRCASISKAPSGLRLINVRTGKVGQAMAGRRYVALSYVWGDTSSQNPEHGFPPVIQDAMYVTKAIGFQYLWVDRYCIDQTSSHKISMIQQMDRVYGNAFVTIIAASSNNSGEGLPGISGPPRLQGRLRIGDTNIIELSDAGPETVRLGKWATRGWTFQEGYLSSRRLIFTEKEVIFLCNEELAKETQTGKEVDPYDVVDSDFVMSRFEKHYSTRLRDAFYWMMPRERRPSTQMICLRQEIQEYSNRTLSHEGDSLNALLGIFRYHENDTLKTGYDRISHLWGVPLKLDTEHFVSINLLWQREAVAGRRKDFPSWSWTGWSGSFHFSDLGDQVKVLPFPTEEDVSDDTMRFPDPATNRTFQILVRCRSGTIDLHRFVRERKLDTPRHLDPVMLIIQSHVIPLRLRKIRTHPWTNWKAPDIVISTFLLKPGVFVGIPVFFDRDYDPSCHMRGLVLQNRGRSMSAYSVIVLHPIGNGTYERAGIMNLSYTAENGSLTNDGPGILTRGGQGNINVHMDEYDHFISRETDEGPPYECSFFNDSNWETVHLV